MLHLAYTVCMVIAIGIDFRTCGLAACGMAMRHRGGLSRKGIDRGCHVVPVTESVCLLYTSLLRIKLLAVILVRLGIACSGKYTTERVVMVSFLHSARLVDHYTVVRCV